MTTLSTLHRLRARLGLAAADSADDRRLLWALESASAALERRAGRRFSPHLATRRQTITASRELLLDDDLLELHSLSDGLGQTIPLDAVIRLPQQPPHSALLLTGGAALAWDDAPVAAAAVTGIWGWHDMWEAAWRGSGDSVAAAVTAAAVSLPVTDAAGVDASGETPRFQVGQMLRIEAEYLRVLAVNAADHLLTVTRGSSGSAAAAHAAGTPIAVFQPALEVEAWALRLAARLYREPDAPAVAESALAADLAGLRRERAR
jgi:hypothetical protein